MQLNLEFIVVKKVSGSLMIGVKKNTCETTVSFPTIQQKASRETQL